MEIFRKRDYGKNRASALLPLLIGCLLLSGCSHDYVGETVTGAEQGAAAQEEENHISYEVPAVIPNICVDRLGYEPESSKVAVFRGEELPDVFTIRDAESGKVVYTGSILKGGGPLADDEYNCYGTFSDFKEAGEYYIQTDLYGESYRFLIHDNLYYSLFRQCCGQLYRMRSGGTGEGGWQTAESAKIGERSACLSIYQLLLSYEMFPSVYTDDTEISESGNGIPDILDECRYEIEWLLEQTESGAKQRGEAAGYRAAALAKYAYLTKNMDPDFAEVCLEAAETAWRGAEKDLTVSDDVIALAASELYRVGGSRQYAGLAEEYLQNSVEREVRLTMPEFWAALTYMNTKNKVDVELCDELIKKVMEDAEEISERSAQNSFLVCETVETKDREVLLEEMMRIGAVNHIITNQEYNIVIENHFHYLMGRNPGSVIHASYWEGQDIGTEDMMEDPVQLSGFIFMLSELLGSR